MFSDVMEDYLKAIYVLQAETGPPVSTSAIAEYLDKTPPTVTSMIGKLEDHSLVDREKYKGVELTTEGETVALEVIRHHRLLETYLTEHLDYSWSEVHEEADRLEHHISEEFEKRVAAALDYPEVDPHGDPIPGADLAPLEDDDSARLTEFEPSDHVVVSRVSDRDDEELAYLEDAGIVPGTELEITAVAPFGMITIKTPSGTEQSLPESVARSVRVTPVVDAEQ
ncbi:metal-dependent transcriptional regulator [Natronocalculus amylovorans]|uniref:Metal-dependent transcriptional regulator n=1 Tax=Natronocalculus amylovorans TaxID=2917812 RepID=A0AAE3K6U8_9EURY|nr:metal-dependent transcriptional regulator [Natronocalculus amylovorans]MCL9815368.1 metal-dependent transcriptional regulator [Natronocalculus amylovorans]NUE02118.1 metal-dependent transcriptional regulator [Halorubraceae archaeon YAN]